MKEVLAGRYSTRLWYSWPLPVMRVVDWNIERGLQLPGIIEFLEKQDADVLTLQEVDLNARRTGNRNIAEELARRLKLDYTFGPEYQEMAEGSRANPAYTGQATLTRWPIRNSRVIRFSAQSGFWEPKPPSRIRSEAIRVFAPVAVDVEGAGRAGDDIGNLAAEALKNFAVLAGYANFDRGFLDGTLLKFAQERTPSIRRIAESVASTFQPSASARVCRVSAECLTTSPALSSAQIGRSVALGCSEGTYKCFES